MKSAPTPSSQASLSLRLFICNATGPESPQNNPQRFSRLSPSFNFPLRPLASCKLVFKEVIFILQVRIGINVPSITPWVKRKKPSHPKAALQSPQPQEVRAESGHIENAELPPHALGAPTGCLSLCWALGTQVSRTPFPAPGRKRKPPSSPVTEADRSNPKRSD